MLIRFNTRQKKSGLVPDFFRLVKNPEGFKVDRKSGRMVGNNAATGCHQFQTAQKDSGYVFSKMKP